MNNLDRRDSKIVDLMICGSATALLCFMVADWADVPRAVSLIAWLLFCTILAASLACIPLAVVRWRMSGSRFKKLARSPIVFVYLVLIASVIALLPRPTIDPSQLIQMDGLFEGMTTQKSNYWIRLRPVDSSTKSFRLEYQFASRFQLIDKGTTMTLLLKDNYVAEARTPNVVVFSFSEFESSFRSLSLRLAAILLVGAMLYWVIIAR